MDVKLWWYLLDSKMNDAGNSWKSHTKCTSSDTIETWIANYDAWVSWPKHNDVQHDSKSTSQLQDGCLCVSFFPTM